MIEIKTLEKTPIQDIIDCLLVAFEGYFVQMPSDLHFWKNRLRNAGFTPEMSWGAFSNDQLVGFILNASGTQEGLLTVFNMGTGILQDFRGQKLVDRMYEFGLPALREKGIKRCSLEVITKNERAITVYQRIGFKISKMLKCYKGTISSTFPVVNLESDFDKADLQYFNHLYSWENNYQAVQRGQDDYVCYLVRSHTSMESIGHFVINPQSGYILQLEAYSGDWQSVFNGISQVNTSIKINNIPVTRTDLINFLNRSNIENHIDQFTMELGI
ncbi:GNAT family N-acetyltransferase [Ekhidna sp.]|uniref:GNAT family N-acetyltransferase n=1 Tax=Ekhidna sp. TaxID=2608089 RepID=UPI0032ED9213